MDRTTRTGRTLLVCALLGLVTLAAFWPVLNNGFVKYDDPDYVTENAHVLNGLNWENVVWAFDGAHAGNWHPLTWLSHMLDVQLSGTNPRVHHATSLLFHLANTLLVFLVLKQLTGGFWQSAFVAAFYGVHPFHVESVAWIAERKDVLSTFFGLLCFWAYGDYARALAGSGPTSSQPDLPKNAEAHPTVSTSATRLNNPWLFYTLALLFFVLGLMSKPMLVTLPCVLLLLDFWPLQRITLVDGFFRSPMVRRLVVEKLPFFVLSATSSALTFFAQQAAGAVGSFEALPLDFRLANAVVSYVRYLGKTIWPSRLAVFYPPPADWPVAVVAAAGLFLLATTWIACWRVRASPYGLVGWLWFVGMLVPVIGIVQVGQQAMADRYNYFPMIGLLLAVVWAGASLVALVPASIRYGIIGAAVVWVALCAALTHIQTGYWKNNVTLFEHALAVTSNNAIAHNNLGVSFFEAGDFSAAEPHFAQAVRLKPNYPDALVNVGICRARQGRNTEALEMLRRAIQVRPTAAAHYNLAKLLAQQNQDQDAEGQYHAAVRLKPEFVEAWYSLGQLHAKQGKCDQAAHDYGTVLRLKADYADARLGLGAVLAAQRKFDEALTQFQTVLQMAPDNIDARFNLATTLSAKGDFAAAAAHFAEVCRVRPSDAEAQDNLGLALMNQGKLAEALPHFEEEVRLHPDAAAHYRLALVQDALGNAQGAVAHYREALRLHPNAPLFLNDLAWLLATHPKTEFRNGREAVRLAEQACHLSGTNEPRFWGTLDAAYAEAGRFEEAVKTAIKTRELAVAAGQPEIARSAQQRLTLYRSRKPYRSPTLPETRP